MPVNIPETEDIDTARTPEADLALIRSMMHVGRQRMGVDGAHLVIWGFVLSCAFLAQYFSIVGVLPPTIVGIWIPTYVIGFIASFIVGKRYPRITVENNLALRVYSTAWNVSGASIGLYFITSILSEQFDHMTITFLTTALFGSAFMLTSLVTGLQKLRYVAFGWWALLIFFGIFGDIGPEITLVLSAASFTLLLIPGFFLKRMLSDEV